MYVLCLPGKFFIHKGNCTFGRKETNFLGLIRYRFRIGTDSRKPQEGL